MRLIDKLVDRILFSIVEGIYDPRRRKIIDSLVDLVVERIKVGQSVLDNGISMGVEHPSPMMREALWIASNVRPKDLHWSYFRPKSISDKTYEIAAFESAEFIIEHMKGSEEKENQLENLSYALDQVSLDEGLYLEFGVFEGVTINHMAKLQRNRTFHGFDCFEGLPEDWTLGASEGSYSTNGKIPAVESNVKLHIGFFDNVIPEFKKVYAGPISLIHIDSDLYSSAKTVLSLLEDQIVPGTIIVFDEFLNYPGFKDHEYKAFFEFIAESGRGFKLLSFVDRGFSVAFRIC